MTSPVRIVSTAALLGIAVATAAFGTAAPAAATRDATRVGCDEQAETSVPIVFDDPHYRGRVAAVVVGPLELRGAMRYASSRAFAGLERRNGYFEAKVALVARESRSLEVTARGAVPKPVLLAYGTREPASTLLIESCPRNTPALTRPGVVGSGTLFTGVFAVPAAACVTIAVKDRSTGRGWRARVAFGRACA